MAVGGAEGKYLKKISAFRDLASLPEPSSPHLLVSSLYPDLPTDSQPRRIKGGENKKCSSFGEKGVTEMDRERERERALGD